MSVLALALSLCVAALGAIGIASPFRLLSVVRYFQSPAGIYAAAAIRLVFGLALIVSSPTSRAPALIRTIGVIILVAGLITPFFGRERFRNLLDWWSSRGIGFIRAWAGFAFLFGVSLAYALTP